MLEQAYVVLVLLLGLGTLIVLLALPDPSGDPLAGESSSGAQQLMWLSLYTVMLWLLLPHLPEVLALLRANPWLPALLGLFVVSSAWSTTPELSFRRAASMNLAAVFGLYLVIRFSLTHLLRLLAVALGIALGLSIAMILLTPDLGTYNDLFAGKTWRGAFLHKQPFGRAAGLGVLASLMYAAVRQDQYLRAVVALIVSFVLLLGADSSTATIGVAVAVLVALVIVALSRGSGLTLLSGALLISSALTVAVGVGVNPVTAVLGLLHRDSTLTGRTDAWGPIVEQLENQPWFGFGVSNFFQGWAAPPSAAVWQQVYWHPTNAHNGYLNLLLDVGFVGLGVFVLMSLVTAWQYLQIFREEDLLFQLWVPVMLLFQLVQMTTEIGLVAPNSAFWMLSVCTIGHVALRHRSRRVGTSRPDCSAPNTVVATP